MRVIILLVVLLNMLNLIYSQDNNSGCGEAIDCSNISTAHRYCKDGKIVTSCEFNPFIPDDPMLDGPLKISDENMPICLNFIDSGPEQVLGYTNCYSDNCYPEIAYVKSDFIVDKDKAEYNWLCLYGLENEACRCTLDIEFSDNPNLFSKPQNQTSVNTLYLNPNKVITENCEIDYSKLKIFLNYTDEFCGLKDETQPFNHFFTSSSTIGYSEGTRAFVNLRAVIMYQLAQIYGFGKPSNNDDECWDKDRIMNHNVDFAGNMNQKSGPDFNFTEKDKCTFMKMYCPDLAMLSVSSESEKFFGSFIFEDIIVLPFKIDNDMFKETAMLEIYNTNGNKIIQFDNINRFIYDDFLIINSFSLSSGLYFLKINNGNQSLLYKIIMRR